MTDANGNALTTRLAVVTGAMVALAAATPAIAIDTVFTGPVGGTWDSDANWSQAGPDLAYGGIDDVHVQPGTGDAAIIIDGSTVNLTTTESVQDLQVSNPSHASDTSITHGVARLNIGSGAVLTTSGSSAGIRVGRQLDAGQAIGSSRGEIVQTGGSVYIAQGANGLRLSEVDGGINVADSYYEISGGSIRGGNSTGGAIVSDLRIGRRENTWGTAEFHVKGSGATGIEFLDLQMAGSNQAGGGDSILHFSIDEGGVETIVVADELQFRGDANGFGNNFLVLDLIGLAPESDITLILADRLNTNGVTNDPSLERFTGMPDGTEIVRQFGGFEYTWLLVYTDGLDDGVLDASVVLDFQSRTVIPEPATAALTAVGVATMLLRRRECRAAASRDA